MPRTYPTCDPCQPSPAAAVVDSAYGKRQPKEVDMKALVLRLVGAIAMTAVVASTVASSSPAAAGTAPTVERAAARADAYVAAWRGGDAGGPGQGGAAPPRPPAPPRPGGCGAPLPPRG